MTQPVKPSSSLSQKASSDREARLAREAAALRANLRKRKQQVGARAAKAPEDEESGDVPLPASKRDQHQAES
ncbi:MAG: hypothetical protein AAYR33_09525 [Acetobacteraceae bacterium]